MIDKPFNPLMRLIDNDAVISQNLGFDPDHEYVSQLDNN